MPMRTPSTDAEHRAVRSITAGHAVRAALIACSIALLAACGGPTQPDPEPLVLALNGIGPAIGTVGDRVAVSGVDIAPDATVTVGGVAGTDVAVRNSQGAIISTASRVAVQQAASDRGVTLTFTVPSLPAEGVYDVTVSQGEDDTATLEGAFEYVDPPDVSGPFTRRINAGGGVVNVAGQQWESDQVFVYTRGATYANDLEPPIAGTELDSLYWTERNTSLVGQVTYYIPVPRPGQYEVRLHFAEIFFGAPGGPSCTTVDCLGERVFDLTFRSFYADPQRTLLSDYDIVAESGGPLAATVEAFMVTVVSAPETNDNTVGLTLLEGLADRGKISAIEVTEVVSGGP